MTTIEESCKDGLDVKMGSVLCVTQKQTRENCFGCPSEKACHEYVLRFGQYVTAELQQSGDVPLDFEFCDDESLENNPVEEQNPKSQLPPKGSNLSDCVLDLKRE